MREPDLVQYRTFPRHIELIWPDGTQRSFLYVWLRDNCPTSRHKNGQKTIETNSLSLLATPEQVSVNELGVLEIAWKEEDHVSFFDVEVLKRKSQPTEKWRSIIPGYVSTWGADLDLGVCSADFLDYMQDENALFETLSSVIAYGFVRLKNAPLEPQTVREAVKRFGYVRETHYGREFHVRVDADPENLADSALPLSPHTDNPYRDPVPTLQLLLCLENEIPGGETILVDGFRVADRLYDASLAQFDLLANTPVSFRFRNERVWLEASTTLLGVDASGYMKHLRVNNRSIRPFDTNMSRLYEFYRAYFHLLELIDTRENQVRFRLDPGDILLFDNERILHGRTGFAPEGKRHLVGCYADRDGLLSKWRILKRNSEERFTSGYTYVQ